MNKKLIDKILEPRPRTITIVRPKYPHYAFQIFTGIIALLLFQIIIYNYLNHYPISLADKIATIAILLIFCVQSVFNMCDEKYNRSVL